MFRQEMQIHSVVVVVVRIVLTVEVRFAVTMMLVFALDLPWMILPHGVCRTTVTLVHRPTVLLLVLGVRETVNRILLLLHLSLLASTIVLMRMVLLLLLLLLMMMLLLPATIDTRPSFLLLRRTTGVLG